MKAWVSAMVLLAGKIGKLVKLVAEEMEAMSLSLTIETGKLFDAMLALEDKRRRLVNFKVITDMLKDKLTKDERDIVRRYVRGESFAAIAYGTGISRNTIARRFDKAIEKCVCFLLTLTYDEGKLQAEYKDIPLVMKTVKKFE